MTPESLSTTLSDLAPALKNHLWQSTLFLLAAALLTLVLRRNHARTRYWLWLAASVKFLIPFSLLITLGSHFATPRPVPPTQTTVYFAMEEVSQPFASIDIPIAAPALPTKHPTHLLPIVLAAVWLAGFTTVLTIWFVYWRRITAILRASTSIHEGREFEILRRLELAAGLRKRIQLLASPSTLGPGIYGIARPILLWPGAISQRLDDAHLESIFAHEICHVRRRDNLTAALHMLVEAIFWFHPLVWVLGARLEAERERACDESVLESSPTLTTRPHIYAESIVKICEFYVESPLPCVSGVTGADLKKRLTDILERHATLNLTLGKKLLLATIGITFIAIPILSGQARAMQRLSSLIDTSPRHLIPSSLASLISPAETSQAADAKIETPDAVAQDTSKPAFEVASIRPSAPDPTMMRYQPTPNGMIINAMTLKSLIVNVYNIRAGSIYGGPEWVSSQQFDINTRIGDRDLEALTKLPEKARGQQYNLMLQQLLESRFKLKLRRETREMPIYALVVAKGGAKLTASPPLTPAADGTMPPEGGGESEMLDGRHIVKRYDMKTFAMQLGGWPDVGRMVIDETGLKGRYDFEWKWKSSPDESGPSVFSALQEQLGLKLEARKGPVETLVIESVEKPSQDGAESVASIFTTPKPVALAQSNLAPNSPAPPTFDVATIKPTDMSPGAHYQIGVQVFPGGRIVSNSTTLKGLICVAFQVAYWQIAGGADWMEKDHFDLEAKPPEEWQKKITNLRHSNVAIEDPNLRLMLQALLIDRFQLKVHVETKTGKVLLMEQSGKGAKLQHTKAPTMEHPYGGEGFGDVSRAGNRIVLYNSSMAQLAEFAGDYLLHQQVIDRTGLTGSFDYKWQLDNPDDPQGRDFDFAGNFPAFLRDMGLKLTPSTGPVETLVIDHAEKPSPN